MNVVQVKVISDMECRGVNSARVYHLCQFVGHYLSLHTGLLSFIDCILQKDYILFKHLNNYRYHGMEDLPILANSGGVEALTTAYIYVIYS